jgi:hypothetical protein
MRFRAIRSRVTQNLHFLLGNYQYHPLPSPTCIRLLEIEPSADGGALRCSLKSFELEEVREFPGINYICPRGCFAVHVVCGRS